MYNYFMCLLFVDGKFLQIWSHFNVCFELGKIWLPFLCQSLLLGTNISNDKSIQVAYCGLQVAQQN